MRLIFIGLMGICAALPAISRELIQEGGAEAVIVSPQKTQLLQSTDETYGLEQSSTRYLILKTISNKLPKVYTEHSSQLPSGSYSLHKITQPTYLLQFYRDSSNSGNGLATEVLYSKALCHSVSAGNQFGVEILAGVKPVVVEIYKATLSENTGMFGSDGTIFMGCRTLPH